MTRLEAHALLTELGWPWQKDRYPPSALLRAQYGVVPFYGRKDLLGELTQWAVSGPKTALAVYTGPGGQGKTRLLLEACRRLRASSWHAGFLHPSVGVVTSGQLTFLAEKRQGVLVVVDYAETRRRTTAALIEAALVANSRSRIVLLARSAGDWWLELRHSPGPVGDFIVGPAASRQVVPPLAPDVPARQEIYQSAIQAFAHVLDTPAPAGQTIDLTAELYDRALFVLLRALSGLLGSDTDRERGLLDFALRREQAFLNDGVRAADLPGLAGPPIRQAAALATLVGGADSITDAVQLMSRVPLLAGQPAAVMTRVAILLHELYPAQTWLAGVQPDLLGEHLVATAIDEDPLLLGAFGAAR